MLLAIMLLLRTSSPRTEPDVWTARAGICAGSGEVLDALTDPAAIADWAPVAFEVKGLAGGRLQAGSCELVTGSIAGISTAFEIEVTRADTERLELVARGPITFDVAYRLRERDDDVLVEATVGVRNPHGVVAHVLRAAVAALLNAGALRMALARLQNAVSRSGDCELVLA